MLRGYPLLFRRAYGREMTLAFRDRSRDVVEQGGGWALLPFMIHIFWDWLRTIVRERDDMETNTSRFSVGVLGFAAIPTIAFVLHDLVFQLHDNGHEATLGLVLTVAGFLFIWACSGYLIARRVSGSTTRVIAGAVAGIVSVGVLWLTFIVLNNVFLDRMSYEPDRIRAFQQSGYATMREYWHHQSGWGPFPLLMAVAAVVGAIGGAVRRNKPRQLIP
jgi:hypothetical protein